MQENWRPIPGYEDCYAVSDQGRIARTATYGKNPQPRWKIMKPRRKRGGYMVAHLCKDGKDRDLMVHRLVWAAFGGDVPDGLEVNHKSGDKADNSLSNLEVVTKSENMLHAFRVLGRKPTYKTQYGSQQGCAKLTEGDIPDIFRLHRDGLNYRQIAARYYVTPECIGYVIRRKQWRHVDIATA
jgi:hypothetical protein